jgi:UDP-N-acetylmuramoyl-tripeptide--D-alanyl-D-alanine ligase
MAELGNDSKTFHQQIGKLAKDSLDTFYTYGELAKDYGGIHFEDLHKLSMHILTKHSNATVLVKGSRMVKLDHLVQLLQK